MIMNQSFLIFLIFNDYFLCFQDVGCRATQARTSYSDTWSNACASAVHPGDADEQYERAQRRRASGKYGLMFFYFSFFSFSACYLLIFRTLAVKVIKWLFFLFQAPLSAHYITGGPNGGVATVKRTSAVGGLATHVWEWEITGWNCLYWGENNGFPFSLILSWISNSVRRYF